MLDYIKKWSYNRKLQEKKTHQQKVREQRHNPGNKLGILYTSESRDDIQIIRQLKQDFKSRGMIVKSLAYIDDKVDTTNLTQKAFSKNNITWDGIPQSPFVDEFINWEFDLLVCPLPHMKQCLEYIIDLTTANLKVGCNSEGAEEHYDIIIDGCRDKQLNDILAEIFQHLKILSN